MIRITWPTRDDTDPVEALELELLERVMRVELTDQLREALGKAYSPSASSQLSHEWKGYGTFSVNASVDVAEVPATRAAIRQVLDDLRKAPVSADILLRARQPMIESLANALKSNAGWMALVDHAQSQPDRIERFQNAREQLLALTPADVQAMAQRYLTPEAGLEVLALPKDVAEPK
ncbi:M16 family metallopeptidase [Novosphingobium resinovorum]